MSVWADPGQLLQLARDTVASPRESAGRVLSMRPPRDALWLMFALVIVVSLFLGQVVALMDVARGGSGMAEQVAVPFIWMAILQAGFLFAVVHAVHRIGRAFGGQGAFEEALLLVTWLQFIFNLVQVIQIVAMLILPPVAGLIAILGIALFMWLLVNFIAELHGFTRLGPIFLMTFASGFALLWLFSFILAVLGLAPDPAGGPS